MEKPPLAMANVWRRLVILGCAAWSAIRVEGLPDARTEARAKYKEGLFLGQLGKTDLAIAAIRSAE